MFLKFLKGVSKMNEPLKKEQFKEFLDLAEGLSNRFRGNSHIVSRRKLRDTNGYYMKETKEIHYFQTFHSLAAKVLPKYSTDSVPGILKTGALSGDSMYDCVDKAVGVYYAVKDLEGADVTAYYKAIRLYENDRIDSLVELEGGYEIYEMYQSFMDRKLDWEESIKLATYYLENDIVTSVEDLPTRYIIVDADALLEDSNENIGRFYAEFYKWCIRNEKSVIFYLLKNDKKLVPFVNGVRHEEINVYEILNN